MSRIALKNSDKMGSSAFALSGIAPAEKVGKRTKSRLKNVPITIHFSFLILMGVGLLLGVWKILALYFLCLCFHEMVHAYFAKKLGYKLGKIRLSISGAVLDASADEFAFKDEILIAISAPIFNLLVALLFVAFWWIYPESYNFSQDVVIINLAIFGFNILPFFPLDGGRVLLGFLSKKLDRKVAVKICKLTTIIFSIILFFLFVLSLFFAPNFFIGTASVNLFLSAIIEDKNAIYKRLFYFEKKLQKTKKGGIEGQTIYVGNSVSLHSLVKLIDARHFTTFVIVDENFKECNRLTEIELQNLLSRTNE